MLHRIPCSSELLDLAWVFLNMNKTLQSMTNWCSQLLRCFQNCMHYSLETGKYRSWALGCFCRKESCSYSLPASCSWGASLSLAAKPLLQLSPFNYLLFHAKSLKKASLHGGLCGRDSWALLCMGQQLSWALGGEPSPNIQIQETSLHEEQRRAAVRIPHKNSLLKFSYSFFKSHK